MAEIDVHDLARESLTTVPFPAERGETFRVHITDRVHQGVWQHASADTSHEICGVLVGNWARDADGPYAQITEFIRCDNAAQKFAEVTFTHESWAQINGEMDTKYRDLRIIGWYHSHPNFGIFLSDRDCFIQEHFFSGPGQIALVVDPVRKTEGIFEWRRGKPTPIHHYWVANRILSGDAHQAPPPGTPMAAMSPIAAAAGAAARPADSSLSSLLVMLIALLMLLLGYMYGGQRTLWERDMLQAGAVAHYGLVKSYKPGFEEYLDDAIRAQQQIVADLNKIDGQLPKANEETRVELEKKRKERQADLDVTINRLKLILARYGLNDVERMELLRIAREKLASLNGVQAETIVGESLSSSAKAAPKGTSETKNSETANPAAKSGAAAKKTQ